MWCQLLKTKADPAFLIIEVEDNDIEFLIKLEHFRRMVDTSPADVCDIEKTIYATKIKECSEISDVFDGSFKYLTFFKFTHDLSTLCFDIAFDECLVRNNCILDGFVDLNHFEFHCFTNKLIVVGNGFNVDL